MPPPRMKRFARHFVEGVDLFGHFQGMAAGYQHDVCADLDLAVRANRADAWMSGAAGSDARRRRKAVVGEKR